MSKTINVILTVGLIAGALNGALAQTCSSMYSGLSCRVFSQDPSKVDVGAVSSSRTWLCNNYPNHCSAVNTGGAWANCNSVEQLSFAMNSYYTQFKSQGASACSFGGIGVVVDTPATSAPSGTTASQTQCQSMYSQASCRTATNDPTQVDATGVTNSRNWLCNVYPQFCLAITNGGSYSTCNSVEQLSWAMSLYYNQYKAQGDSACNFGGIGRVNSGSTPASSAAVAATQSSNSGVDCSGVYTNLQCRTASQDPSAVSSASVTNTRNWLCSSYPALCNGINSGGQYASCNSVQQVSYAMNLYYNQFSYQGSSACNFNGLGQLASSAGSNGVVASPSPAPQLSSKAGLAWPIDQLHDGSNPPLSPYATGKVSWIYTWSWDYAPLSIPSNVEWVPMLHKQADASGFLNKLKSGAYDNLKHILLFNEPDLNYPPYAYQMDVNTAISITLQAFDAMRARGKTWRVGTPVMAFNMDWQRSYLNGVAAQCPSCKFSFMPLHLYTLDANAFKSSVQNWYNTFGLPIWVTEWAQTDFAGRNWQSSLSDVQTFMSDTTSWMNAQSYVERYSWFGVMRAVDIQDKANIAMNWDGSRNTLGDQYVLRGGSRY